MNDKEGIVKLGTRLDFLKQFRNDWMNKLVANEIDLKMLNKKMITSAESNHAKAILETQNTINRAKEFIAVIDAMMVEEEKRGVAQA